MKGHYFKTRYISHNIKESNTVKQFDDEKEKQAIVITQRHNLLTLLATIVLLMLLTGCSPPSPQQNADGGFEGTVTHVREDALRLTLSNGTSVNVDTWAACGDNTARVISPSDQVTVIAQRDGLGFEAQTIQNANGETLCGASTSGTGNQPSVDVSQISADANYEGSVTRVWEDGLVLQLSDGSSVMVDTWAVCEDNTARNISTGDQITVIANRDAFSYDAKNILNASGEPACEATSVDLDAARNSDGGFEGVATSVREDGLRLELSDGSSMRIDTWNVCGDRTARYIGTGNQITVYANHDGLSYEAIRILNANGDPACEAAPTDLDTLRNSNGAFEGVVTNVREDGLRLELSDGSSMRIDTWDVCGDNTARHISLGDQLIVEAERDGLGYDAIRILDATGEPACPSRR